MRPVVAEVVGNLGGEVVDRCELRRVGFAGGLTGRNSMGLANVAYAATLTWANPLLLTLEQQALVPMFGREPVELGLAGTEDRLFARLRAEPPARPAARHNPSAS